MNGIFGMGEFLDPYFMKREEFITNAVTALRRGDRITVTEEDLKIFFPNEIDEMITEAYQRV